MEEGNLEQHLAFHLRNNKPWWSASNGKCKCRVVKHTSQLMDYTSIVYYIQYTQTCKKN